MATCVGSVCVFMCAKKRKKKPIMTAVEVHHCVVICLVTAQFHVLTIAMATTYTVT